MLSARQLLIFKCIVEEFVETAEPVGSKTLMTKYMQVRQFVMKCHFLKKMDI